jgi:SecD/SecF fusion protein
MKRFSWRLTVCIVPVVLAALVVARAFYLYDRGEGGFKLGVDLVGGTILVYEVDETASKFTDENKKFDPQELANAIKRRIDPTDLYNVTIRPVGASRIEIILPTGGEHQAQIQEQYWKELLARIQEKWPELQGADLEVGRGRRQDLVLRVQQLLDEARWRDALNKLREKWPALKDAKLDVSVGQTPALIERLNQLKVGATEADIKQAVADAYKPVTLSEIEDFINASYTTSSGRKDVTGEEVQRIKELIAQVGSLEFRILANTQDDKEAVDDARRELAELAKDPAGKAELDRKAATGEPPPRPTHLDAEGKRTDLYNVTLQGGQPHQFSYSWVELGRQERHQLGLDNAAANDEKRSGLWRLAAQARERGETLLLDSTNSALQSAVLYSRVCQNRKISDDERAQKKYEYFLLTRDPGRDPITGESKAVTGKYLTGARRDQDERFHPAVHFQFNTQGGDLFYELTSENKPSEQGRFYRYLAIVLDGQIVSAPRVQSPIRTQGQISGNFTVEEVDRLVSILRSGALPATLKRLPVSENTIGATLGEDTIKAGSRAVVLAFVAVLLFMIVYYRFAGLVASIALLANLLLTVACMVLLNSTFTLPGLAGLVLTLGMAVDANVLIYERLREERERGASLALAIRNGYDRALPTIIDTHLSSIFTAIVLYAVGNDQLKGFGISLTLGLIISLFTSLVMTRLLFDVWLYKGWLHKLSMFRFFARPNIDFMRIRYYWFTATVLLTVFGITVFLVRGPQGLNIDFVGGTAYGGELVQPMDISQLRQFLDEDHQKQVLQVASVKEIEGAGSPTYRVAYADGTAENVEFTNAPKGGTPAEREAEVKARAEQLPDVSVEQIFLSDHPAGDTTSRYFTVRTSEKDPNLVQVSISRLLATGQGGSLLKGVKLEGYKLEGKEWVLTFDSFASPGYIKTLLEKEARAHGIRDAQGFEVNGEGAAQEGRFKKMRVVAQAPGFAPGRLAPVLAKAQEAFNKRPQPMRLENFDSQLALDTQQRAMYAILASWAAILLYLWFRFGNWTFGLAAVLCLIHDLFFTLGIIAFCHYIHTWAPGFASLLRLQDFKIDLPAVAALLTLVGYSVNDTIVVFDRIREVRGKNPQLTEQMINDSVNQTLSRTILASMTVWLVVIVLYWFGGEGIHLFAFVMVVGVIVGTYSSIYIASPLLLMFGEGTPPGAARERVPAPQPEGVRV